jgi:hypothetical protein
LYPANALGLKNELAPLVGVVVADEPEAACFSATSSA